jgi:imidazolonepropionase-like amidohydrolase
MSRFTIIADQVWDGVSDAPRQGTAVVVNGRDIEAILPANAVDGSLPCHRFPGASLLPGLIDAHVHFSAPMGPAFLAAGVTTVRDVGNDLEWIVRRRAMHSADPTLGPGIVCCGHLHDGPKANWPNMGRPHADAAELEASIRRHAACGVDQIKLYAGINLDLLRAGVNEAHRMGKFVLAHLGAVDAATAVTTGLDEFEHLDRCDVAWGPATPEQDDKMIDLLLQHRVVIDPTLVVWDRLGRILERSFHHDDRRQWVHPCHRELWDRYLTRFGPPQARLGMQTAIPHMKRFVRRAMERGVTVALGTDTPFPHLVPGFSVHDELAMYADAGIRFVDALRSATSVNARVLGIETIVGRIAPGLRADLVVVRGDPLERIEDIGNTERVWRDGVTMSPQTLLRAAEATFAQRPDDAITKDLQAYIDGTR